MNYFELPYNISFDLDKFVSDTMVSKVLESDSFQLPLVDLSLLGNTANELEDIFNSKIFRARLFHYPPMHMSGIHIDGVSMQSPVRYALNIPIKNCYGTKMIFYNLRDDYLQSNKMSVYPNDKSYAVAIDIRDLSTTRSISGELELVRPTVVNTSIAHNVYSPIPECRTILSIRFESSLYESIEQCYNRIGCSTEQSL